MRGMRNGEPPEAEAESVSVNAHPCPHPSQVAQLRAQYNGVVLADKEVYGAGWPLEQLRRLEYGQEVAAAAEAALVEQDAHAQERGV